MFLCLSFTIYFSYTYRVFHFPLVCSYFRCSACTIFAQCSSMCCCNMSVCPSVCHSCVLYQNGWTIHQAINTDCSPESLDFSHCTWNRCLYDTVLIGALDGSGVGKWEFDTKVHHSRCIQSRDKLA